MDGVLKILSFIFYFLSSYFG